MIINYLQYLIIQEIKKVDIIGLIENNFIAINGFNLMIHQHLK